MKKDINLISKNSPKNKTKILIYTASATVVVALLALTTVYIDGNVNSLKQKETQLQNEIIKNNEIGTTYNELLDEFALVENVKNEIDTYFDSEKSALNVLGILKTNKPVGIATDSISIEEDSIHLSGISVSMNDIAVFLKDLESEELFDSCEILYISQINSAISIEDYNYEFSIIVRFLVAVSETMEGEDEK